VADASRKGAEARAAIVLEGKMETLRLREDLEKEFQKRREEWERFERRAEDREAAVERKLEELQRQERGLAGREAGITQREDGLRLSEAEIARLVQEQRGKLERSRGSARKKPGARCCRKQRTSRAARRRRWPGTSRSRPSETPTGKLGASSPW
jgi:septal ring factor EnvC (AmiA/AmiB activator)